MVLNFQVIPESTVIPKQSLVFDIGPIQFYVKKNDLLKHGLLGFLGFS